MSCLLSFRAERSVVEKSYRWRIYLVGEKISPLASLGRNDKNALRLVETTGGLRVESLIMTRRA